MSNSFDPINCNLPGSSAHVIFQANTGVGCHFLLQGIFLTQELNPGLPHCRLMLYQLSYIGSSRRKSSLTRNQTPSMAVRAPNPNH